VGPGGIGKTEAACGVAEEARKQGLFPDGDFFVDLQGVTSAAAVFDAITAELGTTGAKDVRSLAAVLSERRCLLLLDNLETAHESDPGGVYTLLRDLRDHSHAARFLLTSRLEPPLPDIGLPGMPPLDAPDAARLFRELAEARRYRWRGEDDAPLARLLEAWERLPLAIVLGAGRMLHAGSVTRLLTEWEKDGPRACRAAGLPDAAQDRLSSLETSFALSYKSLSKRRTAQRLFLLFGLLPGGASEELLQAVLGDGWEEARDVLVTRSLLQPEGRRWRMLSPLREFSARLRRHRPEDEEACAKYLLRLAAREGSKIGQEGSSEAMLLLAEELPNFHALWDRSAKRGENARASELAQALGVYYQWSAPTEGRVRLGAGATAAGLSGSRGSEANCLHSLGDVHRMLNEYEQARTQYGAALALYREFGHHLGEANCLRNLGQVHQMFNEHREAQVKYRVALLLYRALDHHLGEANCLYSLGQVCQMLDEYGKARVLYEVALILYGELGYRLGEANCLRSLGQVHQMFNDYGAARTQYGAALALYGELGHRLGEANCLRSLGQVYQETDKYDEAREHYGAALALYSSRGDRLGVANCLHGLGGVHQELGEYGEARARYRAALARYHELGHRMGEGNCLLYLGFIHQKSGEYGDAERQLHEALALYRSLRQQLGEANCLLRLGDVHRGLKAYATARGLYQDALNLYHAIRARSGVAETHWMLGRLERAEGREAEAQAAFEQAITLYEALGVKARAEKVRKERG